MPRPFLRDTLQLLLGMAVVIGLIALYGAWQRHARLAGLKPGWALFCQGRDVAALAVEDGTIWAGGMEGLLHLDRRSGEILPLPAEFTGLQHVTAILHDRSGRLWIAHAGGVICRDHGKFTQIQLGGLAGRSLLERQNGEIWAGMERGIRRIVGTEFIAVATPEPLASLSVDQLFEDSRGELWAGSADPQRGALFRFDSHEWITYKSSDAALAHPAVNAILESSDGAIWVGVGFASHGGASCLRAGQWSSLRKADGLAGEKVRSLFEDPTGRLWFGSEYDGLAIRGPEGWRYYTREDGLAGDEPKAILLDPEGAVWIGTMTGISRIDSVTLL